MNIREFKETDTEEVVSLWEECGLTVAWNDPRKDISRKLADKRNLFLVGVFNRSIIASVMGGYDGHRGCINYLAVSPQYQGRRFGELIIREVEARLLNLGCPKINILVRTSNEKIIRFYEKIGYKPDH